MYYFAGLDLPDDHLGGGGAEIDSTDSIYSERAFCTVTPGALTEINSSSEINPKELLSPGVIISTSPSSPIFPFQWSRLEVICITADCYP